jgi:NAD(P)-dependent dehydrogenase (short-subunit alcohol dehydrogenase family)
MAGIYFQETIMAKVWLITGSGSGLGRSITIAALEAGHGVVATARDPRQLADLAAEYATQLRPVRLDVTLEREADAAVQAAISTFGQVDVLVNNAGYGDARPFEAAAPEEFRRVVETNFFGVVNLCRAVLPGMRARRSGHILQISSVGGRMGTAGNAAYHAAKWAVGGFTESLAQEVASFNVKVSALEPGGMRTNWGKRAFATRPEMASEYEATVGATFDSLAGYWGNEAGDPKKIAELVLRVAEAAALPPHIVLGQATLQTVRNSEAERSAAAQRWEQVSNWTDVDSTGPIPSLPSD